MRLTNLTPARFACGIAQCPGVYLEEDGRHLRIIGKSIEPGVLEERIGADETVIRIDRALLNNVGGPLSRFLLRVGL
jgi:hypothetical protein